MATALTDWKTAGSGRAARVRYFRRCGLAHCRLARRDHRRPPRAGGSWRRRCAALIWPYRRVRDYQEFGARGRSSSLADEPFAEDDGELGPRRTTLALARVSTSLAGLVGSSQVRAAKGCGSIASAATDRASITVDPSAR